MENEQVYACEKMGLEMGAKGAMCTRDNVRIILESDVEALMDIWFDEATKSYRVGDISDKMDTTLPEISELFRDYARATYGMQMGQWTDKFVRPEVARHLWENGKDGLKMAIDRFQRIFKWDGVERMQPLLDSIMSKDDSEVFLEWYRAALNRMLNPGSPVPFVLVVKTKGEQETADLLLWMLCFTSRLSHMWNRTSLAPASIEFQRIVASSAYVQLKSVKYSDEIVWKMAVQTKMNVDSIRLPYDRKISHYPRRCSMFMVTEDEFDASEHPCAWAVRTIEVNAKDIKKVMSEVVDNSQLLACEMLASMSES